MQKSLFLILFISLYSCGKNAQIEKQRGLESVTLTENLVANCSVSRDDELKLVEISCPDGSTEIIYDGANGVDGEDGTSCEISEMSAGSMITCGETQAFIKNGVNGADGSACKVTDATNETGALIECSDGSSAFIKNGADGQDGTDGQDGIDLVESIIDPCGRETTHGFDEVILVLSSGDILAHFASGENQYLTLLEKNRTYITTDGTGCRFSIDNDGEIVY